MLKMVLYSLWVFKFSEFGRMCTQYVASHSTKSVRIMHFVMYCCICIWSVWDVHHATSKVYLCCTDGISYGYDKFTDQPAETIIFFPGGVLKSFSWQTTLVQIMAWRRPDDKPLSEPMMVSLLTYICLTRPQWVNNRSSTENQQRCSLVRGLNNTISCLP